MLPSLHRLRLHDAAPTGTHGGKHGGRKGKRSQRKVYNALRKAKHDAKVAAAAAAQRAKVTALINEKLDDDARLEIMKQLVGCPPYGQAMSDVEALISTDSRFAALTRDDGVWKELFSALMAKRMPPEYFQDPHLWGGVRRPNTYAEWLPRMDAFERSMAADEFASWWDAYGVLCHFVQLHELMQGSFETGHPRWWPEFVMYESDGEYPWVDSDGSENDYIPNGVYELDEYSAWRTRQGMIVNMGNMHIVELQSVLNLFSYDRIVAMLKESPLPADATARWYISAVWTAFVRAVAETRRRDRVNRRSAFDSLASYFFGGGLGDLVLTLANKLTPEQLLRHYTDFDAAPLDPDLLELRGNELDDHPLGHRILRERNHIFDARDVWEVREYTERELGNEVGSLEFWSALSEAINRLQFLHGADDRDRW